jgi:hypothetical protein
VDPTVALRSLPGTGALEVAPGRAVVPELGDPMAAVRFRRELGRVPAGGPLINSMTPAPGLPLVFHGGSSCALQSTAASRPAQE